MASAREGALQDLQALQEAMIDTGDPERGATVTNSGAGHLEASVNPATELQHALSSVIQVIDATLAQRDDDAAFALVVALDEALSSSPVFERSLSALLDAGPPGEVVEADLRRWSQALQQRSTELARRRGELSKLSEIQQAIRLEAEEAEEVRVELEELQRLERLANGLEQLRSARRALEECSGAASRAAGTEEAAVETAATTALQAAELATDDLRVDIQKQLERLAEHAAQLSQLRADLAAAQDDIARDEAEVERLNAEIKSSQLRHGMVRTRLAQLTAGWRAHLAADQEIAAVLLQTVRGPESADEGSTGDRPDADPVEEITEHIASDLKQLDELLGTLLMEDEAQDHDDHQRRGIGSSGTTRDSSSTSGQSS